MDHHTRRPLIVKSDHDAGIDGDVAPVTAEVLVLDAETMGIVSMVLTQSDILEREVTPGIASSRFNLTR